MAEIDFGYTGVGSPETPQTQEEPKVNINTGETTVTDNEGNTIEDINDKPNTSEKDNKEETKDIPHNYSVGTTLEVDGVKYSINDSGDVIDEKGEVFKKADEVSDWIKSFEVTEEESDKELTIENISKALNLEIVGEDGNPIQYENTPEGIKSYISDAIETGKEEIAEATINTLYAQYPFVKPMIDYYISNGNSLEGYNQIPDRSNIQIDDNNEAQQEIIIKTAWAEENRRGNVDNYIAYLKSQGTLAQTAKEELEALIQKDAEYKKQLEEDAKAEQKRIMEEATTYWNGVKQVIDSRKIAGYEIPETIIVERDGKKVSMTSNDFFNYLYRTDRNGLSDYAKDVKSTKPEELLQDEILRAYLKFTGGTYADLVKMAINEDKVKNLKLQSKNRKTAGTMRITPPTKPSESNKETFGY